MNPPFEIVALGALDLDRAARLHAEAFAPLGERPWTRLDVAGLLAAPGCSGFLLCRDGEDAGVALCRVAADEAELLTVAVRPALRRQGGGRRLLEAVMQKVREAGATSLFLEVGVDNPAAQALYEGLGFRPVGRRRAYYPRGADAAADAVVMRLLLA
jgi:ribosomal-protein-alanine N-acetyltransferase